MEFNEIIKLAINALKESIDEDITHENLRLAYIKSEDKKFHICSKDEIKTFLEQA